MWEFARFVLWSLFLYFLGGLLGLGGVVLLGWVLEWLSGEAGCDDGDDYLG